MTTLQDSDPIAQKNKVQVHSARASFLVLLVVVAGYALTVLVFYPGYVTIDARYVYADAQAWQFGDWQSPAMGVLWRLIDPIAPGSLSMFLLTVTLYWLGFGMLALIAARRSIWLGLVTPLLAFVPPAFFFVGMVWRDILFGVVWLAAVVLAFAVADRNPRVRIAIQAIALLLVALGVLLRPNAIFAAPFLAAYVVWPRRFDVKRMAIVFVPAVVLFYALVPLTYYGLLDAKRQNPLHSILVFDLGGITHFSGENQFPVSVERGADRAPERQMLRSGALGHLLARAALPVRHATAGAPRRLDLRHTAPRRGVVARGVRTSARLSPAPRGLHVAIPRPLEPGAAGLGLARPPAALASEASGQRDSSEVRAPDTRPEPGCAPRATATVLISSRSLRSTTRCSRPSCSGRGSGSCLPSRSGPLPGGQGEHRREPSPSP